MQVDFKTLSLRESAQSPTVQGAYHMHTGVASSRHRTSVRISSVAKCAAVDCFGIPPHVIAIRFLDHDEELAKRLDKKRQTYHLAQSVD